MEPGIAVTVCVARAYILTWWQDGKALTIPVIRRLQSSDTETKQATSPSSRLRKVCAYIIVKIKRLCD